MTPSSIIVWQDPMQVTATFENFEKQNSEQPIDF